MLSHTLIRASNAEPQQWIYFLHGILGSGSNWRSFARTLVEAKPHWGAVLVDLRMHGASQGLPPPHTVASAESDLEALEPALPGPIKAVLGHSFGGKVALEYAASRAAQLSTAFFLDSMPGARADFRGSEQTAQVLETLEALPRSFATRQAFVDAVVSAGQPASLAQWLAMNLTREGETYALRTDLAAIRAMLEDYLGDDLWPVLEGLPDSLQTWVVIGGRSRVFLPEERARVERLARQRQNFHVEVLPEAGHWVHVEDPAGVMRVVQMGLR